MIYMLIIGQSDDAQTESLDKAIIFTRDKTQENIDALMGRVAEETDLSEPTQLELIPISNDIEGSIYLDFIYYG